MGTTDADEEELKKQEVTSYDDEKPAHAVFVSEFSIARYPVTNAEFRLFWSQRGYDDKEFWSDDGWLWRTGKWETDVTVYGEKYQETFRKWLAGRPVELRHQPFFWNDPQWNAPNLPAVGVTWFEAEAYANWLKTLSGAFYRLPTEAEWEKAARGGQSYFWPWGNQWDAAKCNNVEPEDKIGGTTPVGIYPHGTWPDGPLDMVGNVWEWCADWYDENEYKNRNDDMRDPWGPETGRVRVVRGGSWHDNRNHARCAYRSRLEPGDFADNVGFRLVLSPSL